MQVERPIARKIALTDSCYSSELGEGFLEAVRGLHRAVGTEVMELENHRFNNLTCGMVSILRSNYDLREGVAKWASLNTNVFLSGVGERRLRGS